jgi:hypothetical protein
MLFFVAKNLIKTKIPAEAGTLTKQFKQSINYFPLTCMNVAI